MDAPEGFRAVRTGGIVKFVPLERPQVVEKPVERCAPVKHVCRDCGTRVWRRSKRCVPCARAVRHPHAKYVRGLPDIWTILDRNLSKDRQWGTCECGCLIRPGELCPQCVIPWMRANEHSPSVVYYQPQRIEERRAA